MLQHLHAVHQGIGIGTRIRQLVGDGVVFDQHVLQVAQPFCDGFVNGVMGL
jgi:hypothetical protein